MALRQNSHTPPWGALFFALLGLLWCGYVAFPTEHRAQCLTSGCALTKDITLAGLSLWWIGGAYFFFLMIICLRGKRYFAWRLSQLALFADALLLLLMFFTGPCVDCLVVAFFFFTTALALRPASNAGFMGTEAPSPFFLFPLWIGLFLGNIVIAGNESVPYWSMGRQPTENVRVYFSPSCPACRDAITALGDSAALYPVIEREGDFEAIVRFYSNIEQGMAIATALEEAIKEGAPAPKLSFGDSIVLSVQLFRNKAVVLKNRFTALPLIEINGMPQSWKRKASVSGAGDMSYPVQGGASPRSAAQQTPENGGESAPWDSDGGLAQCGGADAAPCPE